MWFLHDIDDTTLRTFLNIVKQEHLYYLQYCGNRLWHTIFVMCVCVCVSVVPHFST